MKNNTSNRQPGQHRLSQAERRQRETLAANMRRRRLRGQDPATREEDYCQMVLDLQERCEREGVPFLVAMKHAMAALMSQADWPVKQWQAAAREACL